jgi:hypothetical protein
MMTLLSALTITAFSFTNPMLDAKPNTQSQYFEAAAEGIATIQPTSIIEVLRSAAMNVIYTDDQKPAFDIQLAEVTVNSEKAYQFTIEGRTLILVIKNTRFDDCNTAVITAIDTNQNAKLELVDHSRRICKDMVENVWEATVRADTMNYAMTGQPL